MLAQEVRLEGEARGEVAMCAHHLRRLDADGDGDGGSGDGDGGSGDGDGDGGEAGEGERRLGDRRGGEDMVMYGRYFDRYGRGEDGGWRFAARRLEVGWTELRPVRLPG